MAVAYSVVDTGATNNLIKFSNVSKDVSVVLDYIADVYDFVDACNGGAKTAKQLLKQYNEIVATTKKAEKAIISGKLNHTINQGICNKFDKAKKDLQKCRQEIN